MLERLKQRFGRARQRRPALDHLIRTVQHYTETQGPANAGNITYFGFLSFFPVLAIAFAIVGYVSRIYPNAKDDLITAIRDVFPGIIGNGEGQISTQSFEGAAAAAGLVGLVGLFYAGLNWLSATRSGLEQVFDLSPHETPNIIVGKLRDLLTLAAVGTVLVISVAMSTTVIGFSELVRSGVGLDDVPGTDLLIRAIGICIGIGASTVLFLSLFKLLADPDVPLRALRGGALLSAVGFEALKLVASTLLGFSSRSPAAAVFGAALVLVVWIHYFAVVALIGASWAETAPLTVAARAAASRQEALVEAERIADVRWGPSAPDEETVERPEEVVTMVRSAVAFGAITMLLRRAFKD